MPRHIASPRQDRGTGTIWLPEPHGAMAFRQRAGLAYWFLSGRIPGRWVLPSSILHASHGPSPTGSRKAREPSGGVHTESHMLRSKEVGEYAFWRGRRKMLITHTSFHLLFTATSWDRSFFFKMTAPFYYYFFFYFWLFWVFVLACGLSLVAVCKLSCPTAHGVLVPYQGSNPCPLHWKVDSNHWGIPREVLR